MRMQTTDIRQHILDTAKPIILAKGFSGVGLNELLTAANVPKGSFYHYFKSKEAFGEALLNSHFENYKALIGPHLDNKKMTGAKRIMIFWQRWLEIERNDDVNAKCLAVKLGSEVSDLSESMRAVLRQGTTWIIERLARCIDDGRADGSLAQTLNPENTALVLYNLWLGATVLSKIRRDCSALEEAMAFTKQLLISFQHQSAKTARVPKKSSLR